MKTRLRLPRYAVLWRLVAGSLLANLLAQRAPKQRPITQTPPRRKTSAIRQVQRAKEEPPGRVAAGGSTYSSRRFQFAGATTLKLSPPILAPVNRSKTSMVAVPGVVAKMVVKYSLHPFPEHDATSR